jgi:hypothetical protein
MVTVILWESSRQSLVWSFWIVACMPLQGVLMFDHKSKKSRRLRRVPT